jgi:hypothetical protein
MQPWPAESMKRPPGLHPRADRLHARRKPRPDAGVEAGEVRMGVSGRHLLAPASAGGLGGRLHRLEAAAVFPILPAAFLLVRTESQGD